MKKLRLWLAAALFMFGLSAIAQHHYVEKMLKVDGNDKIDLLAVDKVGQIILSGYLDGKIKAYRFSVKDSVLKWSEPTSVPPNWQNQEYYFSGDQVLYKGIAYEALIEAVGQEPTEYGSDFWARVELREPLLKRRFYPTEEDTLSKVEFLSRMVSHQPNIYPAWDISFDYYMSDIVTHTGRDYEAVQDNNAREPGDKSEYWMPTNQGSIQFYRLSDAKNVSVLFNYSIGKADTTWNPQMITVHMMDESYGIYRQVAHFYYDDVMAYLNKMPQPAINNLVFNRLSNTLLIQNQLQRPEYLKWLKAKFKVKAIIAAAKWISDPKLFQAWLATSDSIDTEDSNNWRFFQDLNSRNLILVRVEYKNDGMQGQPFLTIPAKSLEKLYQDLKINTPVLNNYSDALQDMTYLTAPAESHYLDSIQPRQSRFKHQVVLAKEYFFIEKYAATISKSLNPDIAKMLPLAWPIIDKQFYAKILKEESPRASFYEDNFDWRKVSPWSQFGLTYYFDQDFGLDDYWYFERDSISTPQDFTQLFVTYRKYLSPGKSSKVQHEPIYIAIEFKDSNTTQNGLSNLVYFRWLAVKEQLLKSGITFSSLIKAIETGKLEFYDSELVYGLREK